MEELHIQGEKAPENGENRRIYLSGAISSRAIDQARHAFQQAEDRLRAQGWDPINPLKNGLPVQASWSAHMAVDILSLLGCSAIYMLSGWENSQGATLEANIARMTGKPIYYEQGPTPEFAEIKAAIQAVLGVTPADLSGGNRDQRMVYARMIFAKQAKETGASFSVIGKAIRHHHTTVIYWLNRYPTEYQYTPEFRKMADRVSEYLNFC